MADLLEVTLVLEVEPMSAEERRECGDEFWEEDEDGAVAYAADDIATGIASLLECDGDMAREVFAGTGHFLKINSAKATNAQLVGPDEAGRPL